MKKQKPISIDDFIAESQGQPRQEAPHVDEADQGKEFVDQIDENIASLLAPDETSRNVSALDLPEGSKEGSLVDPNSLYSGAEEENPRLQQLIQSLYAMPK